MDLIDPCNKSRTKYDSPQSPLAMTLQNKFEPVAVVSCFHRVLRDAFNVALGWHRRSATFR
jgi:hypothetical protein